MLFYIFVCLRYSNWEIGQIGDSCVASNNVVFPERIEVPKYNNKAFRQNTNNWQKLFKCICSFKAQNFGEVQTIGKRYLKCICSFKAQTMMTRTSDHNESGLRKC